MAELSIPQELRTAVTRLRCDHSFPCNPPGGTLWAPGPCEQCGMPWDERNPIADLPDELREPLAAWLESAAGHANQVKLPAHQAILVDQHALSVARALLRTPSPAPAPAVAANPGSTR